MEKSVAFTAEIRIPVSLSPWVWNVFGAEKQRVLTESGLSKCRGRIVYMEPRNKLVIRGRPPQVSRAKVLIDALLDPALRALEGASLEVEMDDARQTMIRTNGFRIWTRILEDTGTVVEMAAADKKVVLWAESTVLIEKALSLIESLAVERVEDEIAVPAKTVPFLKRGVLCARLRPKDVVFSWKEPELLAIVGRRAGATALRASVVSVLKTLLDFDERKIPLEARCVCLVLGRSNELANRYFQLHTVLVAYDDAAQILTARGPRLGVMRVEFAIANRLRDFVVRRHEMDRALYRHVVGPKGATVNWLRKRFKVDIEVPGIGEDDAAVVVRGRKADVDRCVESLAAIASEECCCVHVPKQHRRLIIGRNGATINELRRSFNVVVDVPAAESDSPTVRIVGATADVLKAKKHIQDLLLLATAAVPEEAADRLLLQTDVARECPRLHTVSGSCEEVERRANSLRMLQQSSLIEDAIKHLLQFPGDCMSGKDTDDLLYRLRAHEAESGDVLSEFLAENEPLHREEVAVHITSKFAKRAFGNARFLQALGQATRVVVEPVFNAQSHVIRFGLVGPEEGVRKMAEKVRQIADEWAEGTTVSVTEEVGPAVVRWLKKQPPTVTSALRADHNVSIELKSLTKVTVIGASNRVQTVIHELGKLALVEDAIQVAPELHGLVIGRNGAAIALIRQQTGITEVVVPHKDKGDHQIKLFGTEESVGKAKIMIQEMTSADRNRFGFCVRRISVPKHMHPKVIGRGGNTVKEIRGRHAVHITFPAVGSSDTTVVVRGKSFQNVDMAIEEIEEITKGKWRSKQHVDMAIEEITRRRVSWSEQSLIESTESIIINAPMRVELNPDSVVCPRPHNETVRNQASNHVQVVCNQNVKLEPSMEKVEKMRSTDGQLETKLENIAESRKLLQRLSAYQSNPNEENVKKNRWVSGLSQILDGIGKLGEGTEIITVPGSLLGIFSSTDPVKLREEKLEAIVLKNRWIESLNRAVEGIVIISLGMEKITDGIPAQGFLSTYPQENVGEIVVKNRGLTGLRQILEGIFRLKLGIENITCLRRVLGLFGTCSSESGGGSDQKNEWIAGLQQIMEGSAKLGLGLENVSHLVKPQDILLTNPLNCKKENLESVVSKYQWVGGLWAILNVSFKARMGINNITELGHLLGRICTDPLESNEKSKHKNRWVAGARQMKVLSLKLELGIGNIAEVGQFLGILPLDITAIEKGKIKKKRWFCGTRQLLDSAIHLSLGLQNLIKLGELIGLLPSDPGNAKGRNNGENKLITSLKYLQDGTAQLKTGIGKMADLGRMMGVLDPLSIEDKNFRENGWVDGLKQILGATVKLGQGMETIANIDSFFSIFAADPETLEKRELIKLKHQWTTSVNQVLEATSILRAGIEDIANCGPLEIIPPTDSSKEGYYETSVQKNWWMTNLNKIIDVMLLNAGPVFQNTINFGPLLYHLVKDLWESEIFDSKKCKQICRRILPIVHWLIRLFMHQYIYLRPFLGIIAEYANEKDESTIDNNWTTYLYKLLRSFVLTYLGQKMESLSLDKQNIYEIGLNLFEWFLKGLMWWRKEKKEDDNERCIEYMNASSFARRTNAHRQKRDDISAQVKCVPASARRAKDIFL